MSDANPPEGWYPDPVRPGVSRWWDGEQWTERVQFEQGADVAAAADTKPVRVNISATGEVTSGRRRVSTKVIVLLALVVALVVYMLFLR